MRGQDASHFRACSTSPCARESFAPWLSRRHYSLPRCWFYACSVLRRRPSRPPTWPTSPEQSAPQASWFPSSSCRFVTVTTLCGSPNSCAVVLSMPTSHVRSYISSRQTGWNPCSRPQQTQRLPRRGSTSSERRRFSVLRQVASPAYALPRYLCSIDAAHSARRSK